MFYKMINSDMTYLTQKMFKQFTTSYYSICVPICIPHAKNKKARVSPYNLLNLTVTAG